METKRTPTPNELYETPWKVTYDEAEGFYSLRSYTGQRLAKVITQDVELPSTIVRAVNAHQELLAACKAAKKYLALDDAGPELDAQLSQAIAKAEGR